MTTNTISVAFGSRHEQLIAFACPEAGILPRVRPLPMPVDEGSRVAEWQNDKYRGVSVPGRRGVT